MQRDNRRRKVDVITLGCSKNLVDSERLLAMLRDAGCDACHEPAEIRQGTTVIVNTCGFIGDAKEESVNEILRMAELRSEGKISSLIVMGCLSERYRDELRKEIPEVDRWYGKTDWVTLASDISKSRPAIAPYERVITTPSHHAYIKVAEGCNRFCSFCAIPLITGRFRSRPIEEIVEETRMLVGRGVKEFNVIAQDLSSYGRDIYGKSALADMVDRMADVEGVEWIRLHYAYPADFPLDLLNVMAKRPNVCRYLDIALQHIADPVLKNMRRHINAEETRQLLAEIRRRVPGIHIRTTLMTGFPGEGEAEFNQLLDFVREQRFERMGAFAYCEEEDTFGAKNFADVIPQEVKQARLDKLMALQEEISMELQQQKVGKTMKVIIDREEPDYYVGRTEFDSPEVDPEVLISKQNFPKLMRGNFCNVRITDALPFELIATYCDDNI